MHFIIVDLRPESSTYLDNVAVELTEDNCRSLYVPERFANGYQVLEEFTEISYHMGEFYAPLAEGGLSYKDPQLGLVWPLPVTEINSKDEAREFLSEIEPELRRRMTVVGMEEGEIMIIVDRALQAREEQGKPIRVGMIGAGFMAKGLANQIVNSVRGMRMAAIYNRHPQKAFEVYRYAGIEDVASASTQAALDVSIQREASRCRRGMERPMSLPRDRCISRCDRIGRVWSTYHT